MDKLTTLNQRAKDLANILSAPIGSAGDDYITADQRERYEAELSRIHAEIVSIENEGAVRIYLNPTQVFKFVHGLAGDPSFEEAIAIIDEVTARPWEYLTTGTAGFNFGRILAIAGQSPEEFFDA